MSTKDERADKKRVRQLVTTHLRDLAAETVSIEDPDLCSHVEVTRAKALAYKLWELALADKASLTSISMLLDRLDGRVADQTRAADSDMHAIPAKIAQRSKDRMNRLAGDK